MSCSVCGNSKNNLRYVIEEKMFGSGEKFDYIECSICGSLQLVNIPSDLGKYYPSNYYSFEKVKTSDSKLRQFLAAKQINHALSGKSRLIGGLLCRVMPRRIDWIYRLGLADLHLTKQSRILDVGCGGGGLIFSLAYAGFNNVLGIDPFIEADISYNNKPLVCKAVLEELTGEFDLIMFHHSFEHLTNQLETLKIVNRLLSKDGVCLIHMPIVPSFAWNKFKENWVNLDAPRHICMHSKESTRILSNKAGFEVYNIVYNSWSFQFWGSIQYQKNIPLHSAESYSINPSKSIFSSTQILEFERQSKELNLTGQGDSAIFYLKKKLTG
jgi:SAM-dependent methyltransferase